MQSRTFNFKVFMYVVGSMSHVGNCFTGRGYREYFSIDSVFRGNRGSLVILSQLGMLHKIELS